MANYPAAFQAGPRRSRGKAWGLLCRKMGQFGVKSHAKVTKVASYRGDAPVWSTIERARVIRLATNRDRHSADTDL